jgi:hypothetical protein
VRDVALKVDEVDLAAATLRREQSETWKCPLRITSAQTSAESFGFDLFNRRHNFLPFVDSKRQTFSPRLARSERE